MGTSLVASNALECPYTAHDTPPMILDAPTMLLDVPWNITEHERTPVLLRIPNEFYRIPRASPVYYRPESNVE